MGREFYYLVKIITTTSPGPFDILYTLNGVRYPALLYSGEPALNVLLSDIEDVVDPVIIRVPSNFDEIIIVDSNNINCEDKINNKYTACLIFFIKTNGDLYSYTPPANPILLENMGLNALSIGLNNVHMFILTTDKILVEYNSTISPFGYQQTATYGPINELTSITCRDDEYNLYGVGQNNIYRIRTNVLPALDHYTIDLIATTQPPRLFHEKVFYNDSTDTIITISRDYTLLLDWPYFLNEYDLNGNLIYSINITSKLPNITPVAIFYYTPYVFLTGLNGEIYYLIKQLDIFFKFNTFSQFSYLAHSAQLLECSEYHLGDMIQEPESTVCVDFSPYLNGVTDNMTGYLSVGDLVSDTGTVDDYVIDWYLDNQIAFSSGSLTSGVNGILYHPFNGASKLPANDGIYTPQIRWIKVNGELYSREKTNGYKFSPDLTDCLSNITVLPYSCDGSGTSIYDYEIAYNWTGHTGELLTRTVAIRFVSSEIKYFAWQFYGYSVSDRVTVELENNGNRIALHDIVFGTDLPQNDFTQNPILYRRESSKVVEDLTNYSININDKIIFTINPSYYNKSELRTNWNLSTKCLKTLDYVATCEPINIESRTIDTTIEPVITDNGNCEYTLQLYSVEPATPTNDFINYLGIVTYANYGGYTDYSTKSLSYKFSVNKVSARIFSIKNECKYLLGTISLTKTGPNLQMVFSNIDDYRRFKNKFEEVYNSNTIYYNNSPNSDYHHFTGMQMLLYNHCADGKIMYPYHWHHLSPYSLGDETTKTISITITNTTNAYNNIGVCDTTEQLINGYINTIDTNINRPNLTNLTIEASSIDLFSDWNIYQTIENVIGGGMGRQNFVPVTFFGGCDPSTNKWVYEVNNNIIMYSFYRIYLSVLITNVNDPVNNFVIYNILDSNSKPIEDPNNYIKVYDKVNGIGTWYI